MTVWKGINHARMTPSMSALTGAEYKILATVRRLIPDGERRRIKHKTIARKARVSESTVSQAMSRFDGIYVRRRFLGYGPNGGYEIETIPPVELQRKRPPDSFAEQAELPIPTPSNRSHDDHSDRSSVSGVPTPQTEEKNRSLTDHALFLLHDHMQQQQQRVADTKSDISNQVDQAEPPDLSPDVLTEFRRHEADRKIIFDVRKYNPHVTVEQIRETIVNAQNRATAGDARNPIGLALHALRYGQKVTPPRHITTEPPESSAAPPALPPPDDRPGKRRSFQRSRQERRCLTPTPESVPIAPDTGDDSLHAQAVRLLGPTAHPLDIQRCIQQLAAAEEAAAEAATRTERREVPDPGGAWAMVVTAVAGLLPAEDIERLRRARLIRSGPVVVIGVASDFERHVLQHRCAAALRRLFSERIGYPVQITIQVE